jgi:hypothetical protein
MFGGPTEIEEMLKIELKNSKQILVQKVLISKTFSLPKQLSYFQ